MPLAQTRFSDKEESLRPPDSLMGDENYQCLIIFLEGQRLWQQEKRRGTKAVLFNLKEDRALVFNPHNWQIESISSIGDFTPSGKLNGLLVFLPSGDAWRVKDVVGEMALALKLQTPVFIFEEKGEKVFGKGEIRQREEILEGLSLVEKKILVQPSRKKNDSINKFLVWRVRMPAERRLKEPINLVEKGPKWRRKWIKEMVKQVAEEYRQAGFTPLNAYEIGTRLRATRFPPDDLGRLELGFGFMVQAPCGCQWQIDLKGGWLRVLSCGDSDCDGVPHFEQRGL